MKTFAMQCDQGHGFDLMVKSAEALADQQARGLVTCPYCDSAQVARVLASPSVIGGKGRGKHMGKTHPATPPPATLTPGGPVTMAQQMPASVKEEMAKAYKFFADLRAHVEAHHENVGRKFADEARAIHYGETEVRGIYGEASEREVKDLIEEGVEIAPLPSLPKPNA